MLLWSVLTFDGKISSCLYSTFGIILAQCLLKFSRMDIKLYLSSSSTQYTCQGNQMQCWNSSRTIYEIRAVQPDQHMLQDIYPFFSCPFEFIWQNFRRENVFAKGHVVFCFLESAKMLKDSQLFLPLFELHHLKTFSQTLHAAAVGILSSTILCLKCFSKHF